MTITLTPEQLKWLEAEVAAGRFSSIEDAVRVAVADLMAIKYEERDDELARLRTLIDEGDTDIAAGRVHRYASADELAADVVGRGEARSKPRR
jgi:antitoxin ParD1/3/4